MEDETIGKKCGCLELEERASKAEERYIELERELQKRNKEFKELESEKLVVGDSLFDQLMVNKALEYEKEVLDKDWKSKFEKLVEAVRKLVEIGVFKNGELEFDESVKVGLELASIKLPEKLLVTEKNESCKVSDEDLSKDGLVDHQISGSLYITTLVKDFISERSRGMVSSSRRVYKTLSFEGDGSKSAVVVEKESDAMDTVEERNICEKYEDDDVEACEYTITTSPPGRKRKQVVTSDSETDDDRDVLEEKSISEEYEDDDVEASEDTTTTSPPGPGGRKRKRVVTSDSENDDDRDVLEEKSISEKYEDDDVEASEDTTTTSPPGPGGRKRKLVVTSDSENDDDDEDNIPISTLKRLKPQNQEMSGLDGTPSTVQRRVSSRLREQRVMEESERNPPERLVGVSTTGNGEDDETEEEGSERESESLDSFIVEDDDDDGNEAVSENSDGTEEEEVSDDGEMGYADAYADAIAGVRRDKNREKGKWEDQADMLADFGKDPELCMRAVCALYRLQTEDEKVSRSSHVRNGRGFSKFDAERGTDIAQFLTKGDAAGDLKKSVEELGSFKSNAVETCVELAMHYSEQLFAIYKKREDPFFTAPPSP